MEREIDPNFKKQFKLTFIKSIKQGFKVKEIKQELKKQSYSRDLIDQLIDEAESDKTIQKLIEPQKISFFEKIKKKLFKLNETAKIKRGISIHSFYYNLIIDEKIKLNEESSDLEVIFENIENKKLILYFIKMQKKHIENMQKKINSIFRIAKSLVNVKLEQELKNKINNILGYLEIKESKLKNELKNLTNIKKSINSPEELNKYLKIQKNKLKEEERELQKRITIISKKSQKFKEIISEL